MLLFPVLGSSWGCDLFHGFLLARVFCVFERPERDVNCLTTEMRRRQTPL